MEEAAWVLAKDKTCSDKILVEIVGYTERREMDLRLG